MMDTILNLGLNDETVQGLAKPVEASALRARLLPPLHPDVLGRRAGGRQEITSSTSSSRCATRSGVKTDAEIPAEGPARTRRNATKASSARRPATTFRRTCSSSSGVPSARSSTRWNNQRAITYRKLNQIPDDWGTAVNVQSMVFGNMGDDCATGVAFTRNPANGEHRFFGEYLPNAQGEDVVAGIRTPLPISNAQAIERRDIARGDDAGGLRAARGRLQETRKPLPRHAGHRVHDPVGQALPPADAHRQAHRLRRGEDRLRHGRRRI